MKPTRSSLDALVPHLFAAPKDQAEIHFCCRRPNYNRREFMDALTVTVAGGIEGCRWSHSPWLKLENGSGDPRIQVSILQRRVLDQVWSGEDDDVPHPGDSFIVDMDLSEENIPVGTLLKAGTATLRAATKWNNACVKWKVRYGADALDWVRAAPAERRRGILCEIVEDGIIRNGDILQKL